MGKTDLTQFGGRETAPALAETAEPSPGVYSGDTNRYDPEQCLASVVSGATTVLSASYDGDGLRAVKTAGGTTTYYANDEGRLIAELRYNAASSSTSVYALTIAGADGVRAQYFPGGPITYAYMFDPEGNGVGRQAGPSPVYSEYEAKMYDAYGHLLGDYEPFGTAPTHVDPMSGFGGQWGYYGDSETGLYLLGHRYYDPSTGRFLNRDPIGYGGGLNLYGYAGGNPVNAVDPSGYSQDMDPAGGPNTVRLSIAFYIPTKYASGFAGDNRGPNRNTSNYRGEINVEVNHSTGAVRIVNLAGSSKLLGLFSFSDSSARMHGTGATNPSGVSAIHLYGGVANKVTYAATHLSIDYDFNIKVDPMNKVTLSGKTTNYPAMEVWEYTAAGTKLIYDYRAAGFGVFHGLNTHHTVVVP